MERKRFKRKEPVDRLKENIGFLQEMIENPTRFGAYLLIRKTRNSGSKVPLNVNLLDLKVEIDKEIKKLNRRIFKKLKLDDVPDGRKN
ncbi:MAG TPA: hypothetical protein HA367_06280 [Candidatus Methanofastidiosum sp.]|nr:hypothetical protein [Methanofastidiosum sp.]